mgnify:FL=1|tara:strand:+ start:65 stop:502 length:438 start_codon:yes stop_codon:yes gene_type:complete
MILISHRGNLNGKKIDKENSPQYIKNALNEGFDVEIDVWHADNNFYLGHDEPEFLIKAEFLQNKKLWCHAKNLEALLNLSKIKAVFFWHQDDDYTLTSNGYIWTYPGKKLTKNSICVLPEINNVDFSNSCGVCSDYILKYKNYYD